MITELRIRLYGKIKDLIGKKPAKREFVNPFNGATADEYSNPYQFAKPVTREKREDVVVPKKMRFEFLKLCGVIITSDFRRIFLDAWRVAADNARKARENKEIEERFVELAYGRR